MFRPEFLGREIVLNREAAKFLGTLFQPVLCVARLTGAGTQLFEQIGVRIRICDVGCARRARRGVVHLEHQRMSDAAHDEIALQCA